MGRQKKVVGPDPIDMEQVSARAVRRKNTKTGEAYYFRPDGKAYWQVRRRGSSKERETLDTFWATREQALAMVAKLVADGVPKDGGSSREISSRDVRTVADLIDTWVKAQKKRHEADKLADESYTRYETTSAYWLTPLGDVAVHRMTRDSVDSVVNEWLTAGSAPRTVEMAVKVLRMVIRWGYARELCPLVDLKGVAPKIDQDKFVYVGRTPSPAEFAKVLAQLPDSDRGRAAHLQAIVGARIGEIAALKPTDYDRARGVLYLSGADPGRHKKGKPGGRRPFPLPPEARRLVLEQVALRADEPKGYLFRLEAHPSQNVNSALKDACAAAGVPRFSTHGLRRMVVMRMLEAGSDPKTVSKLTGHSLKTLLTHYVRPTQDHLMNAVTRADLGSFTVEDHQGGRKGKRKT